jgi:hypothetical protein
MRTCGHCTSSSLASCSVPDNQLPWHRSARLQFAASLVQQGMWCTSVSFMLLQLVCLCHTSTNHSAGHDVRRPATGGAPAHNSSEPRPSGSQNEFKNASKVTAGVVHAVTGAASKLTQSSRRWSAAMGPGVGTAAGAASTPLMQTLQHCQQQQQRSNVAKQRSVSKQDVTPHITRPHRCHGVVASSAHPHGLGSRGGIPSALLFRCKTLCTATGTGSNAVSSFSSIATPAIAAALTGMPVAADTSATTAVISRQLRPPRPGSAAAWKLLHGRATPRPPRAPMMLPAFGCGNITRHASAAGHGNFDCSASRYSSCSSTRYSTRCSTRCSTRPAVLCYNNTGLNNSGAFEYDEAGLDIVYNGSGVDIDGQAAGGSSDAATAAAVQQAAPMVLCLDNLADSTPEVLALELDSLTLPELLALADTLGAAGVAPS